MDSSKLILLQELINGAEISIKSAKQVISELTGIKSKTVKPKSAKEKSKFEERISELSKELKTEGEQEIIEGVFNGQSMFGPDKKIYPIPANYASKSKLIPGDILKLTIKEDGSFIYKQIKPIDRVRVIGPLAYEEGQYKVLTNGKSYKVLLASVTYFKAEVGDKITIIIPTEGESEWGAIENVLPRNYTQENALDEKYSSHLKEDEDLF